MINDECFEKTWIDNFRNDPKYRRINPPLLEKMIYAFYLLLNLKHEGLEFVFKGGTCLVLLLEDNNRFSIDIDIITVQKRDQIESILDSVVNKSKFNSWKLDKNRSYQEGVPKAHYEFEYNSNFNPNNIILLDILFEENIYPNTIEIPIRTKWFHSNTEIKTYVPDVDSIVGDKLTALAPNTTGILYNSGKEIELIKQLFDLNCLFENIKSIEVVNQSFKLFVKKELSYRSLPLNDGDVLLDIIKMAKLLANIEKNLDEPDILKMSELKLGISSLNHFLIDGHFRMHHALEASSKIAYLASTLLTGKLEQFKILNLNNRDTDLIEDSDWNFLNKHRKLPENMCITYWKMSIVLLKEFEIVLD